MGIYNRDYYRDWCAAGQGATPVVKYLIVANVVVFLLQIFVVRENRMPQLDWLRDQQRAIDTQLDEDEELDPATRKALKKQQRELDRLLADKELDALQPKTSVVQQWCQLDTSKTVYGGQVWRLITHAFCHDRYSVFHILINMLCLYWFGATLELMYGSREFLLFYLTAAVVAGLALVGLDLYTGSSVPGIGASGAVMAVMMLYTMHFPRETICICWFFPVEMRWVMVFFVIWDLHPILLTLSGEPIFTGVAHAAHLGGLAFGFLYARYEWRLEVIGEHLPGLRWERRRRPRLRVVRPSTAPQMSRVDQVLEKISVSGQDSLTEEERAVLQEASARLRSRPPREDS
jgi:membrane associated rhomboid family serine protease